MSGPRQKIQYTQLRLALVPDRRGEPPAADRPGTEPLTAERTTDRPAAEDQLMEEVCDRNNLEIAWKRVRGNKGSPGVDEMTIDDTATYLREHWPTIRAQLLAGTYTPQPVKRVDIPKPDGGVQTARRAMRRRPSDPASAVAGAPSAVGPDVLRAQLTDSVRDAPHIKPWPRRKRTLPTATTWWLTSTSRNSSTESIKTA